MFNKIHRGILTLMLLTTGMLLSNASYAAVAFPGPLPVLTTNPDIIGNVLDLSYDYGYTSTTNRLTINQSSSSTGDFRDSGNNIHIISGLTYSLSAILDDTNNNQLLSGTLTITGGISDLSIANNSTLLVATLTNLGTSWPTDKNSTIGSFQFLGNVTSSAGALGFGPKVAVKYLANGTLNSGFFANFDFTGQGSADNNTKWY